MLAWLHRYLERVRERRIPYSDRFGVEMTQEGFRIIEKKTKQVLEELCWSDVVEIWTWKRDYFAYDQICLVFTVTSRQKMIEIEEGFDGFVDVMTGLCEQFPGIPETWYSDVMLPAFATKETLLYRR